MSGHSKWSKIKHQKGATDAVKGKIFTKMANAIINAVGSGGGNPDPETNFKLRLAVEKARSMNMPKEKIERAIERAAGGTAETALEETIYEGFGPNGVGILIETLSNNKQRIVSELKNIFDKGGGSLATTGAVSHYFQHVGLVRIEKKNKTMDQVFEEAVLVGAQDIEEADDAYEIYTNASDLHRVKQELEQKGFIVSSSELYFRPVVTVPIDNVVKVKELFALLETLEELDEVQKVFSNFDVADELIN